jgi:hypothetical protein
VSVPFTRTLPYVLREQLQQAGVKVLIGTVTAVPDRAHVRVDIGEGEVTIPKLASYAEPAIGEPAFVLVDPLFTVALGSVSATPPPPITDASTLDGIDSTGFVRTSSSGSRIWVGGHAMISSGPSGLTTLAHPLGVQPYCVAAPVFPSQGTIIGIEASAALLTFHWSVLNQNVSAHALAIAP